MEEDFILVILPPLDHFNAETILSIVHFIFSMFILERAKFVFFLQTIKTMPNARFFKTPKIIQIVYYSNTI